ncbi:hypothetical protein [Granulicoccus phenolivorans]|uniref:hypothetical protein n=1 Tax=Granulicoccus phenolivorans TaxID=266854 RepID=UPI0004135950|nr:hypothetical protein [Granulicoccus phenolivorans]
MKRLFWFAAGAAAGAYVALRVRKELTPASVGQRLRRSVGLAPAAGSEDLRTRADEFRRRTDDWGRQLADFWSRVRNSSDEYEVELREALGMTDEDEVEALRAVRATH